MTTTVLRYRCDLCGTVWLMRGQADLCEMACAELAQGMAGEAPRREGGSAPSGAPSPVNEVDAPKPFHLSPNFNGNKP